MTAESSVSARFLQTITPGAISEWFLKFGQTDLAYLKAHFKRFMMTHEFAMRNINTPSPMVILDVGAHWLHQAFFFANDGHALVCVDAAKTLEIQSVQAAAKEMGARLIPTRRLDKAEGISDLPDNSINLMLFCEIIEHIAFNPIRFWKEVYRVLKPSGKIVITTPNAYYGPALHAKLQAMTKGNGMGIPIDDIFRIGTHGHHWKEFSTTELRSYFQILSQDFQTTRLEVVSTRESQKYVPDILEELMARTVALEGDTIFQEVTLMEKKHGVQISPPWEID